MGDGEPREARGIGPSSGVVADERAETLLAWGEAELTDRPWRRTRDPWPILVSEVMAQQTQIGRVAERWPVFLAEFPTVAACAAAGRADVVRAWAGLGYNRRAVALHTTAVAVVERHGGEIPTGLDELLALPGIGPYTARAVRAFAFEEPAAVLDTNVGRVLARWAGETLRPASAAQARADELADGRPVWLWNQTLMEFGARVCTKRAPACDACPLRPWCAWQGQGDDPAVGSAAVSTGQPRFEGSDREARGALVTALRRGPVTEDELAAAAARPDDPAAGALVAESLVADGLARRTANGYALA